MAVIESRRQPPAAALVQIYASKTANQQATQTNTGIQVTKSRGNAQIKRRHFTFFSYINCIKQQWHDAYFMLMNNECITR